MEEITVLDMFERTVQMYREKTAIYDENRRFTYGELYEEAQILGYAFYEETRRAFQRPIILFIDKGCDCLAAMLGIMYSGNIYVPMDIATPVERVLSIVTTLQSTYIIATKKESEKLKAIGYDGELFIYEELIERYSNLYSEIARKCVSEIKNKMIDTDLMYILFTSGSTGIPKGVAVAYRSVIDYIDAYIGEVGIACSDILGNQTPFYTDMSLKDLYMSLKVGATICIIPQKYFMTPKKLLQYLQENKVTTIAWVPTAYRIVSQFDALSKIRPEYLSKFIFSGESMPTSVYNYWRSFYKNSKFIQQYGPTEITGACTSFTVEKEYKNDTIIPIGKPFGNTRIILLDENDDQINAEQMPGVAGEICVSGTCLSMGYYNNPEKTREVFVQNPCISQYASLIYRTGDLGKWDAEGNLIFVSRKDYQIKHAGKRIELGEIEVAVLSVEKVKACCCVQNRRKDALALYYTGEISGKDIAEALHSKLPGYMIPTIYNCLEELPVLPSGKLNRKMVDQWANEAKKER